MSDHLNIIRSNARIADEQGMFPGPNLIALADSKLPLLVLDGGEMMQAAAAVEEVSSCCASTGLLLAMHYIYSFKIMTDDYGDEERDGVRRAASNGYLINTFGVDNEMGSMNRGGVPPTKLIKKGSSWFVHGHKIYCSGAKQLGYYLVRCHVQDGVDDNRAAFVLVKSSSSSIEIRDTWHHLGLRASESHDVLFHEVQVSEGSLGTFVPLFPPKPARHGLWNDVMLSSMYNGIAKAARSWFVDFLKERKPTNLGASLATVGRLQDQLGMMDTEITNTDLLIQAGIRLYNEDKLGSVKANQIKTLAAENSITAIEIAVKNSGNHGLTRHNDLERHWRDIQTARVNMPQADMVYSRAGKALLGI